MIVVTTLAKETSSFPPEVEDYFPFKPRPGQALMGKEIYYGVLSKNHVAIEGAAGLGKTVTCLSALLPICKREDLTLLYAARTHTQMQRVIEELGAINKLRGHKLTGISMYGRANMCLNSEVCEAQPNEAMELCGIFRRKKQCEHYENLKAQEIDEVRGCLTAEYIRDFSLANGICPYYLGKALLPHCQVVALTYVYLIDPFIRSVLFNNLGRGIEQCVLVLDECHNLPELAMHAMSQGESDRALKTALKEYHRYDATGKYPLVLHFLKYFLAFLANLEHEKKATGEEVEVGIDKAELHKYLLEFVNRYSTDLYLLSTEIQRFGRYIRRLKIEAHQPPYSSVLRFGLFMEHFIGTFKDPQYLHYVIISKDRTQYYIRCIDCRSLLRPLSKAHSIVSMSGTLEPINAYLEICGFPSETKRQVLPSPFDRKNVKVLATRGLDVTYFKRTPDRYNMIADRCLEVIRATPGNTAIFCASYEVLGGLLRSNLKREIKKLGHPFFSEKQEMTSQENDEMITKFKETGQSGGAAVLAGVCGGRNSEGVDFPGAELYTAMILGVPLARMTHSINALITYYTRQFGVWKGKEYAYTLPAFRRANQAAGRPIRTLTDYGVIVLLDERYTYPYYRRFLSHWINENMIIVENESNTLEGEVLRFYAKFEKNRSKTERR
jgi:DNA excision repair protein ERCC-2